MSCTASRKSGVAEEQCRTGRHGAGGGRQARRYGNRPEVGGKAVGGQDHGRVAARCQGSHERHAPSRPLLVTHVMRHPESQPASSSSSGSTSTPAGIASAKGRLKRVVVEVGNTFVLRKLPKDGDDNAVIYLGSALMNLLKG